MRMPSIFTGLRNWMFEEALPFWSSEGVDRVHGGDGVVPLLQRRALGLGAPDL